MMYGYFYSLKKPTFRHAAFGNPQKTGPNPWPSTVGGLSSASSIEGMGIWPLLGEGHSQTNDDHILRWSNL